MRHAGNNKEMYGISEDMKSITIITTKSPFKELNLRSQHIFEIFVTQSYAKWS
jgi:hypothetical protein